MATRTIANGGGNWNVIGTWVEGAVPLATDDVVATATSGNLTVPAAYAAVCKTMILTNYVGLLTINATGSITVSGAVTLVSGATYTGGGTLVVQTTATLTANTVVWPGNMTFQGTSQTFTLADNWSVTGLMTVAGTSPVINSNQITVAGGLTMTSGMSAGTSKVVLTGGTWSGTGQTWFDFDIAGNVTVSGSVLFGSQASSIKTLKYVSGTVTTTGSTLTFNGNNGIFDTNGISWNNFTLGNTVTTNNFQLNSLLTVGGIFTHAPQAGNYTLTFAGTAGMSVNTWRFYGANTSGQSTIINLKTGGGITYTVTNTLELDGLYGVLTFKSTSAGTKATFNMNTGVTISVVKCAVQDIDSSGGTRVLNLNGTISNTTNWINSIGIGESNSIYFS